LLVRAEVSAMTITRREMLLGGLAAGAASVLAKTRPLVASASQPSTKINFDVPPGSCDCHVHVFGDPAKYPFFAGRTYTPEPATTSELRKLLSALRLDRVLVVHPSVYGTDNTCMLDALAELGNRARGIAVIDVKTSDAALDQMAKAGVRGLRLNLSTLGVTEPAAARQQFDAVVARAKPRNWHIQFNTSLRMIDALSEHLMGTTVPVVFDHFGGASGAGGVQQPGFQALVNLVKSGKAYVKISGAADQMSNRPPDYPEAMPLARALVAANPQRILWGSSWPHPGSSNGRKNTEVTPLKQIDDGQVLNLLTVWVPDGATRKLILVDNPARLYGF
jgi:predicted TIM-barrel fold metal-dependent hydrolase